MIQKAKKLIYNTIDKNGVVTIGFNGVPDTYRSSIAANQGLKIDTQQLKA
ncbi:MAG: hypothetical protein ACL7AX_06315 [Candidatus Arsenophonus phytopathogenicus]